MELMCASIMQLTVTQLAGVLFKRQRSYAKVTMALLHRAATHNTLQQRQRQATLQSPRQMIRLGRRARVLAQS